MKTALLLSTLLVVAPAAATALGATSFAPITKDGVEITVLPQIGAGGGSAAVTEVGLDIEAVTADAAARLGAHSLRAVADVDCGKSANRFVSAEAFDQSGLAGPGRQRNITGQWVQPSSDSYMAAVIMQVCTSQKIAAAAAPPIIRQQATARAIAPRSPGVAAHSAPLPAAQPAAAPDAAAAPAPSGPLVVKFSGGVPVAPPPAAAAPPPAHAPAAAPAPSGPLVVKFSGARAGVDAAAASPSAAPSFIPRVAGDRIAQVAASANVHDAEKVLRQLKPLLAPPLTTNIEQAVVGTAHVYRADVVGFSTAAEGKAFCRAAAPWSKTCWVRAKGDEPAKPSEHLRAAKRAG